MLRFLEKMREKSEGERRTFALFVTFTVTGVVAVAWLFSIGTVFSGKIDKATEKNKVGLKPFEQISNAFKSVYTGVESSVSELGNTLKGQPVEIVNEVETGNATSTNESGI